MLDLSALDEKEVAVEPSGVPLRFKWRDIEPDPNQPRTEKTPEEIAEMGQSIKDRGVKQPISIKTHPTKPGMWMINDGELRWLGTQWAGLEDIPIIIDEDFDDFDQVNANEKRFALRPMEVAVFVKRKLDEGVKKAEIARRLGKDAATITHYVALATAPACIEQAYRAGKCMSPKTLYELQMLHGKFPEQVESWCAEVPEITRATVQTLADELKGKKSGPSQEPQPGTVGGPEGENLGHDQDSGGQQPTENPEENGGSASSKPNGKGKSGQKNDGEGGGETDEERDLGELTSWPRGKAVSDPDLMKKPLLLVEYEGRSAAVLLNRKPSTPGLVRIRFEDGGGDAEVEAGLCKINLLTEAEK